MKANFLVSAHPQARIPGTRRLFVTDPYVIHVLEKSGELGEFEEVVSAEPVRATREAFVRDHEFVDRKYHKHVEILSRRLNEVQGTQHEQRFWNKAMGLGLLRHITFCYNLFQSCEEYLDQNEHDCRILSESSYFTPNDFNEHRRFFQHSDFGQEQLFSIYCRLFHRDRFREWSDRHQWPDGPVVRYVQRDSIWQRLARLPRRVARELYRLRSPTVGIINSYFSEENFDKLLFGSKGRVQTVRIPTQFLSTCNMDWAKRNRLTRVDAKFDRFDRFAFEALRHALPRAFVEDAGSLFSGFREFFAKQFPKLRWVVSEAWIGDMNSSVALAVLGERRVNHLYNEHNYFAHPFLGNNLEYLIPLVDEFATLGWRADGNAKIVPSASLFKWVNPKLRPRLSGGDILFVSSLPQVRAPEINASYGEAGPVNVPRYFEFVEAFLSALPDVTRGELVVRAYPTAYPRIIQSWDFKYRLRACLAGVKKVDNSERGARVLMYSARLVVLDYFSTSCLESMLADIPTVFMWNTQTRYPLETHRDFFAPLQRAGICQTDPIAAARFVELVKHDPREWWQRSDTKAARQEFLAENFGEPLVLIKHLIKLAATP